jgi:hypothetical protein
LAPAGSAKSALGGEAVNEVSENEALPARQLVMIPLSATHHTAVLALPVLCVMVTHLEAWPA